MRRYVIISEKDFRKCDFIESFSSLRLSPFCDYMRNVRRLCILRADTLDERFEVLLKNNTSTVANCVSNDILPRHG